jgi:hypothetical protein
LYLLRRAEQKAKDKQQKDNVFQPPAIHPPCGSAYENRFNLAGD